MSRAQSDTYGLITFAPGIGIPVMAALNANLGVRLHHPVTAAVILLLVAILTASWSSRWWVRGRARYSVPRGVDGTAPGALPGKQRDGTALVQAIQRCALPGRARSAAGAAVGVPSAKTSSDRGSRVRHHLSALPDLKGRGKPHLRCGRGHRSPVAPPITDANRQ